MSRRTLVGVSVCALLTLAACAGRGGSGSGDTVRLVDLFGAATVENAPAPVVAPPALEWRFEEGIEKDGWKTHDVASLAVRDGLLRGRATAEVPLLYVERTAEIDEDDLLHSVEVALRVREGGELAVRFDSGEEPDLQRALNDVFPWPLTTPLVPGDDLQRYTLRPSRPVHLSSVRHLLLRPTDTAGASFALESVRVISRREHLAGIESGVGWHGMNDRFRESIVTRAPETVSFRITLPERPWLDLALATVEPGAATFRIRVDPDDEAAMVFERTISRPHRWNPARLPLDALAGRSVTLSLELEAHGDGFLGFWGTAAVRSGLPPVETADARPQGVIVLLADTLRSDHVDAWGYTRETAPVLASLAGEGVRMQDCVSQATWTKVSVPSIFTAMYPTSHTVAEFTDRLPVTATTMAEVFRGAGYATLALTSISFTGQFTNLHQGYEELHESSSLEDSSNAKTAREYVDRLLPWLEDHRDVPFFVFLHVADPHSPYRAYEPFDTRWGKPGDAERLSEYMEQVRPHIESPLMKRFGMPTRDEIVQAGLDPEEYVGYELDAYDGSIRAMDVEVGRLFERLRELGLEDDVLFAFVSDHGTEFLDHDRHFHGQHVYGELNRVPMFLWRPRQLPAGVVVEPTVQTIDLMPTILELAGLELPGGAQGRSLLPVIDQAERGVEQQWQRPAITEKALIADSDLPGRNFGSVALIADGWKLIRNEPARGGLSEFELFDHRQDPLNLRDLAADEPQRVAELATRLEGWREQALAARLDDAALAEELDDAELERLRSLGYLK